MVAIIVPGRFGPMIVGGTSGGGGGYTGPGNIVSGATCWYGLRGYNAAYATGSNPAIDVVDTATGATTTTINILSDGTLDVATIAALGYAVSVKKIYDQVGTNHASQATLSKMPTLTLNALNTNRPAMAFAFASSQVLIGGALGTITQPFTISSVAKRTGNTGTYTAILTGGGNNGLLGNNNANNLALFGGGGPAAISATDNTYHAIQAIFNNPNGVGYVDQTATTGLGGGAGSIAGNATIGFQSNGYWGGNICEVGLWPLGFTGTTNANSLNTGNMNTNQHNYWGVT